MANAGCPPFPALSINIYMEPKFKFEMLRYSLKIPFFLILALPTYGIDLILPGYSGIISRMIEHINSLWPSDAIW